MTGRPRIIVAGYLVRFPVGGYVWQALHYLLGFRSLGYDVWFYEDSAFYPLAYDPPTGNLDLHYDYGIARTNEIFARHGLADRWVFWDAGRDAYHGLSKDETNRLFASADLFVNLAGVNRLGGRPSPAARLFLDLDPGVTQINFENRVGPIESLLAEHNLFFTVGENIGTARSGLPAGGIDWRPTRPPVISELWRRPRPVERPFTTVGRWDSTARDLELHGVRYHWRKSLEWMKFLELPRATGERFEMAMDVPAGSDDERRLRASGWEIVSPMTISVYYHTYRDYISGSKGEFSAAKGMNVELRSGWFSDRSVCYLAAGRPVVVQDTGFGDTLPTGRGVFAVRTLEDAAEAVRTIAGDYDAQSAAAREIAGDCFEATRVLGALAEAAGL